MNRISTSENTMSKQTTATNDKSSTAKTSSLPRRMRVSDLLFAVSTLGAAVVIMAMRGPKIPPTSGD